jgi:hypothetical protein
MAVLPTRKLLLRRKWLFAAVFAVLAAGIGEMMAAAWLHSFDHTFTFDDLRVQQQVIASGSDVSHGSSEILHPYLGWVHDPQLTSPVELFGQTIPANRFGLLYDNDGIFQRQSDRYVIAVAGGSVAWQFAVLGRERLRARLAMHPLLKGRRIEIACLAASGYKQPQQLLAYQYFRSIGAEYDAVINIDGYNETALAMLENVSRGTAVSYPRSWHAKTIVIADPTQSANALRLLTIRANRQSAARKILDSPFRHSSLFNLLWVVRDKGHQRELIQLGLDAMDSRGGRFRHHGPVDSFNDETAARQAAIDLWGRSSIQLDESCHAADSLYVHVLQPNQYLAGSKVFTSKEEELVRLATSWEVEQGDCVDAMYPKLIAAGKQMAEEGIVFSDQSGLFVDIAETVYADGCCHYNSKGYELLADSIAHLVGQNLKASQLVQ